MSAVIFTPMRDEDEADVIALWEACDLTRPWNPPEADIAHARGREASDILVARAGDRLIATVMVGHEGHRAWVYYLAVDPAYRRQGVAGAAMRAAEDWAIRRDMPKMHLMIRPENAAVMAFYESLGYEDGRITMMQKWLDPERLRLYAPRQR